MERSSRHHNATATALEWKHRAARGTCGITDENTGSCIHSSKGSFGLPKHALDSWTDAASYCLDRCKQCARCQHVSISLKWKDCSWFARCDNLDATGPGVEFLSGRAPWFAAAAVEPPQDCFALATNKRPPPSPSFPPADTSSKLLLGVFSFLGGASARRRRDMLRRMWNTDDSGVIGVATTRFLMLSEDLNNVRTRGEERLGDLWAFESVRPSWWPSDKPQLDKSRRAWMSRLGTLLLLNAFVKRGLEVRP